MSYTFEDLIESVKKRPEIWQRSHPRFCNSARKISWNEISKEMKAPEIQLRRSWKYLVDQYRKESKAPKRNLHTSQRSETNPVWPYFFHMSFIKNEMIIRQTRRKIRKHPNTDTPSDDAAEASISAIAPVSPSAVSQEALQEYDENYKYIETQENTTDNRKITEPSKDVPLTFPSPKASKVTNYSASENAADLPGFVPSVINQKVSKADLILRKLDGLITDVNDDDYMFFKSVLPMVKTLSPVNKLQFRIKINEWLLDMMSGDVNHLESVGEGVEPGHTKCEDGSWCDDIEDNKEGVMMDVTVDEYGNEN